MPGRIEILPNREVLERGAVAAEMEHPAGHQNMKLLIQLRWLAVIGQISTIFGVGVGLGIALPVPYMLEVLSCLIAFNLASLLRWHERQPVSNTALFLALLVDVTVLTAQLYLSGGISNPFAFLYLLQVILSAVLLEVWSTWIMVAITSLCLAGLALLPGPLILPIDPERGFSSLYVQGMLICFILNAALLVVFITRINRNLRAGDAKVADLRQRAAEEEHIVRMGLLASGAAHELGTPLATLSVILGDWRRMPELSKNSELLEEITEMQAQLQRCKSIVSGILMSAGEARGESSVKTTINTFLNDLVDEWRTSRPIQGFEYDNRIEHDVPGRLRFDPETDHLQCARQCAGSVARLAALRSDARSGRLAPGHYRCGPRLRAVDADAPGQALPKQQGQARRRPGSVPGGECRAHPGRHGDGTQPRAGRGGGAPGLAAGGHQTGRESDHHAG